MAWAAGGGGAIVSWVAEAASEASAEENGEFWAVEKRLEAMEKGWVEERAARKRGGAIKKEAELK